MEEDHKSSATLQKAFTELTKKITIICFTLLTIGIMCSYYPTLVSFKHDSITLFSIITLGYLLEILLSPFERILETKQEYKRLWFSYAPYLIFMSLSFIFVAPHRFSLVNFLILLHCARISGSLIMWGFTKARYRLRLPIAFMVQVTTGSFFVVTMWHLFVRFI